MATQPHLHQQIPIKTAARKLPIKRKTFAASSSSITNLQSSPNAKPKPNHGVFHVKPETPLSSSASDALAAVDEEDADDEDDLRPPPFKFHRIWQESDEISFLQGLLDSSADGLVFPRDLNAYFDRFSTTISQPYTKSQLAEKLRRLKKKFRVLSARLDRGLDAALTPHDRALLHLSKQLWHPAFAASSPFFASSSPRHIRRRGRASSSRVAVRASFDYSVTPHLSQLIPVTALSSPLSHPSLPPPISSSGGSWGRNDCIDVGSRKEAASSKGGSLSGASSCWIERGTAKVALNVLDQCLKEQSGVFDQSSLFNEHMGSSSEHARGKDLTRKWQAQRFAELDVLARRMRLVLEHGVSD